MKEPKIEEAWDKKKIIIASLTLLCLLGGVIYFFDLYNINASRKDTAEPKVNQSVKGETEAINTQDVKEVVQQKIEEIKTEASSIDIVEIASSSPQVQKIVNDIKALESYPANQAKSMCEKICDSF